MDTVLVTGCSSGVGRATARAFAREEWTVYAGARTEDDLAALEEAGHEPVELDVTDPDDCARAVAELVEAEGRIDCLVNNAGYAQLGAIEDVQPRKLREQFDTNLYGPHRLIRAALPHMRAAGDGTIVNVSSWIGRVTLPGGGAYAASKAALESLSDALRAEVEEFGVDELDERAAAELVGLDRSGAYDRLYDLIDDRQTLDLAESSPADVADAILQAASCTDPAPRYPVGTIGRLGSRLRHLPPSWVDAIYGVVRRLPG
jgi:NAD(P)-dependent dehydrogenase (short-subunit alcohol dehydrogenase family)